MTYAALVAQRNAAAVAAADRRGTVLRHASDSTHIFVTQYELSWDRIALPAGRLESAFELKRVGRFEAGHLFRTGYNAQQWSFSGWINCPKGCGGAYTDTTANTEMQLLKEFLRGNCDSPRADAYPDPRLVVQTMQVDAMQVLQPHTKPFAIENQKVLIAAQPFADATPVTTYRAIGDVFMFVPDSFKVDKDHNRNDYYNFTFTLEELPAATVIT
jgi:hypothetical protein